MSNLSVVVGLGANLGSREDTLRSAVAELRRLGTPEGCFGVSSLYESEPVGPPQPRFLNAAVRLCSELEPLELLDELQAIEAHHGRVRGLRWGPRVLDLDLLWIEGAEVRHERLVVPHPELGRRLFALLPMLEVAPDARTLEGQPWRRVAAALPREGIARISGPTWAGLAPPL